MKLIIVESPTKARTISSYLGKDYKVIATVGHLMDLPQRGLGIDLRTFSGNYRLLPGKSKLVNKLKKVVSHSEQVYIATDPDREGEAIAYHLSNLLNLRQVKRIELREITPTAVRAALNSWRSLDMGLVIAQHTRRVLDRLVGYTLSPLLWSALSKRGLSAGRVQSVALKLICDREQQIENFKPEIYYVLKVRLRLSRDGRSAELVTTLEDRGKVVRFRKPDPAIDVILREARVKLSVKSEERRISPPPPLKTSDLQAECAKRGLSAPETMRIAQKLFEGVQIGSKRLGLITYHRTDSYRISQKGKNLARDILTELISESWFVNRNYRASKGAQDAHEAIRPTTNISPNKLRSVLNSREVMVYDVIWRRFLSAFSPPLKYHSQKLSFRVPELSGELIYRAGKVLEKGFTEFWSVKLPEELGKPEIENQLLEEPSIEVLEVIWEKRETEPPSRYTQASLIKTLERLGVGRPSTYAVIMSTLFKRGYVLNRKGKLYPTQIGRQVNEFIQQHFPDIINERFTSQMEEGLDRIEEVKDEDRARRLSVRYLSTFWSKLEMKVNFIKRELRAKN